MNEFPPTQKERREALVLALAIIGIVIFLALLGGAFTYLSLK